MRERVYIETTIPSFYYNDRSVEEMVERQSWTRHWWDEERVKYDLFRSVVVLRELENGNHSQKSEKLSLVAGVALLDVTEKVLGTAAFYVANKAMPQDPFADALHLSLASHYGCDIVLTWNCVHLANGNKMGHLRRLTTAAGLKMPEILTPLQLLGQQI